MAASSFNHESTLSTDLMACLGREDIADMHLIGTDGVKVPAFRSILACRSDVFCKMLLGNFEESSSNEVELDYDSNVLKAVVEFCITDNVLEFGRFANRTGETGVRTIVQLIACAHFLNMPVLQNIAELLANATLSTPRNYLACAIYDEAFIYGEPTESAKLGALSIIRSHPEFCLLFRATKFQGKTATESTSVDSNDLPAPLRYIAKTDTMKDQDPFVLEVPGVLFLRADALRELISDDFFMACEEYKEITLLSALNEWATVGGDIDFTCSLSLEPTEDRMGFAKDLASTHFRLSSIKPSQLIGVVRKSRSGIISRERTRRSIFTEAV